MPGWQSELEALLAQLHVALEPGRLPAQIPPKPGSPLSTGDVDMAEDAMEAAALPWDVDSLPPDDIPADGDEVNAVSREIEVTVRRVISMARAGQMEAALRDDVVFVLQALTRPSPYERTGRRRKGKAE